MMHSVRLLVIATASVFSMTSCASLDVNALPAPGNSFSGGYPLIMEFDNALNLPGHAKVTMDGLVVGVVTGVRVAGNHVDVTAQIDPDVSVPSNIHVDLQQATVLGDIYVALDRPTAAAPDAPPLGPGSRISLAHTTSPPRLEDTIARFADFIGSGSIQRVQNAIIGLNRITPPAADVRTIASRFSVDLAGLANNIDTVDQLLKGTSQTAQVLDNRIPELKAALSPVGVRSWDRLVGIADYVSIALPTSGGLFQNGYWLVPFLNSLADAFGAIQHSKWAFESEVHKWAHLFTDYYLPQDKYPAINITSIVGPDGRELSGNVHDVLRILGAMP
jgi:phospholipid/cholesterol/gamma-HCH transport system substrate-binding protein